jgi:hypothetical protein
VPGAIPRRGFLELPCGLGQDMFVALAEEKCALGRLYSASCPNQFLS